MAAHNVKTLIYSSTCATYGEPDTMPITEATPQVGLSMHGLLISKFKEYHAQFTDSRQSFNQCRTLSIHMERQKRWQRTSF